MRKLKRVNVPNIPEQSSQPSDKRKINKKEVKASYFNGPFLLQQLLCTFNIF